MSKPEPCTDCSASEEGGGGGEEEVEEEEDSLMSCDATCAL